MIEGAREQQNGQRRGEHQNAEQKMDEKTQIIVRATSGSAEDKRPPKQGVFDFNHEQHAAHEEEKNAELLGLRRQHDLFEKNGVKIPSSSELFEVQKYRVLSIDGC